MSIVLFPERRSVSPVGLEDFDLGGTTRAVNKLVKLGASMELTRSASKISADIMQAPILDKRNRKRYFEIFARLAVNHFRLVPGPAYRVRLAEIEVGDRRRPYLVKKALVKDLRQFVSTWLFFTRDFGPGEEPSIWGLNEEWIDEGFATLAVLAERHWAGIVPDYSAGLLRIEADLKNKAAVRKPSVPLAELVRSFFGRRIIRSVDDPVVRQLRAES